MTDDRLQSYGLVYNFYILAQRKISGVNLLEINTTLREARQNELEIQRVALKVKIILNNSQASDDLILSSSLAYSMLCIS